MKPFELHGNGSQYFIVRDGEKICQLSRKGREIAQEIISKLNNSEKLSGDSVPTPSDEDIQQAAYSYEPGSTEMRQMERRGFENGAKWVKEWLRSSTVGNSGNKG